MHVAVAGNIGSGKTTLAGLLANHYGWEVHYEEVEENPYLADFYNDMKRWSFNLQVYFLKSRFSQIVKIRESNKSVIQDRTIYEDSVIFAANLYDMGLMSPRDYENYSGLFDLMSSLIAPPDLLIYLRASVPTLVRQIEMRGRPYESSIRLDYLRRLNERYEGWIRSYKASNLLIVDVDKNDFIKEKSNLSGVIDKVDSKIHGLF
ncbi:MAG: deoxyadenosine/deoxycytidine kinase [Anaerophaga sp.]|nr:deoxyadenosine/deoxycytidine kinase [Anaerophaga sp.]MDN5292201.1 deoxyadenosine/deoxycytidine kinase [Anaerophaga sp.]